MNILFISNWDIPDVTETVEENLNSRFLLKSKRSDVANSSWSLQLHSRAMRLGSKVWLGQPGTTATEKKY